MKLRLLALSAAIAVALPAVALANGDTPKQGTPRTKAGSGRGKAPGTAGKRQRRRGSAPTGVVSPTAVRPDKPTEVTFGKPIQFHNISVVPVVTTATGPHRRYSLLENGLKDKTLSVRELKGNSGEAQVNSIEIRNKGETPVYLLGGEMVLGGKQDRIIARDTVVGPTGKWIKIDVFCVERQRWRGQNMKFTAGKAVVDLSVQRAAMKGSQTEVWNEVTKKNVLHGTQSQTESYRRTIQNKKLRKKIKPYVRELKASLPRKKKLAGLVFGINGKIHVADVFGNPMLFSDLSDKLLSAYVLEALGHQVVAGSGGVSAADAQVFIGKGRRATSKRSKKGGRTRTYSKETPELIGSETVDADGEERVRETYIGK